MVAVVKIRMLEADWLTVGGVAVPKGGEAEVSRDMAKRLIAAGWAEPVPATAPRKKKSKSSAKAR